MGSAAHPEPPRPSSFAGLLSALAGGQREESSERHVVSWMDQLEDDVATVSYEHALKAHGRYRSAAASDEAITQAFSAADAPALQAEAMAAAPAQSTHPFRRLELRSASITVRLSPAEYDQLRERAAAAGLTISAYLRSCTLEAENLRALVKDAMARLKAASEQPAESARRGNWWQRLVHPAAQG